MKAQVTLQLMKKGDTLVRDYPVASPGIPPIELAPDTQINVIIFVNELFPGQEVYITFHTTLVPISNEAFNAKETQLIRTFSFKQDRGDIGYAIRVKGRIPLVGAVPLFGGVLGVLSTPLSEATDQNIDFTFMLLEPSKPPLTQAELDSIDAQVTQAENAGHFDAGQLPTQIAAAVLKGLGLLEPFAPVLIAAGAVILAFTFGPQLIGALGAGIAGVIRGAFRSE